MAENSGTGRLLRLLTVICAVIGAIWVIVQISNYFFPSDYKLEAYGDTVGVQWPALTKENQQNLNRLQDGPTDEELKTMTPGLSDLERIKLSNSFKELVRNNPPRDLIDQFKGIESIWWFTIRNVGNKEVTNAQLELPFDGLYVVTQNNEGSELTPFKKVIPISSIRPSNSANVIVWTYSIMGSPNTSDRAVDDDYFNYNFIGKDTRVTHPNGVVRINYPIRSRSTLVAIVTSSTFQALVFLLLFVIISMASIAAVGLLVRKLRSTQSVANSPETPTSEDNA